MNKHDAKLQEIIDARNSILRDFSTPVQDSVVIDFITAMSAIYLTDVRYTARKSLKLKIPVENFHLFEKLTKTFNKLVTWVSGENFRISFKKFNSETPSLQTSLIINSGNKSTLFSGGLDSLTGLYINKTLGISSDYIGFVNKSAEKTAQNRMKDFHSKNFDGNKSAIKLINKPVAKMTYRMQSTRSLLYFALAVCQAHSNSATEVVLYENGILSLNPTLYGRTTTKTTHPQTIFLYNNLLCELGLNIQIKHPFIFKTKGENIENMNRNFKSYISQTYTCGAGRAQRKENHIGQCGVCIPCILRKISISAFDNEEFDVNYHYPFNIKPKDIDMSAYQIDYISIGVTFLNLIEK